MHVHPSGLVHNKIWYRVDSISFSTGVCTFNVNSESARSGSIVCAVQSVKETVDDNEIHRRRAGLPFY